MKERIKTIDSTYRKEIKNADIDDIGGIEAVVNDTLSRTEVNNELLSIFPEYLLFFSSVVTEVTGKTPSAGSNKDLLHYHVNTPILNIDTTATMMNSIRDYINKNFNLEPEIPTILNNARHLYGAQVYVIVPVSEIYRIAKLKESKGTPVSTEEHYIRHAIDNKSKDKDKSLLTLVTLDKLIESDMISNSDKSEVRSEEWGGNNDMYNDMFNDLEMERVVGLKNTNNYNDGLPLIINPPMHAVVPVHPRHSPHKHVGYYILLDDDYNPMPNSNNSLGGFGGLASKKRDIRPTAHRLSYQDFTTELRNELIDAITEKEGNLKSLIVEPSDEVLSSLYRYTLARKRAKVVYVPKELVQYYSFDRSDINGVGIGMMEKIEYFLRLRAYLMMSNVNANIDRNTTDTLTTTTLDPDVRDPKKAMAIARSEHYKSILRNKPYSRNMTKMELSEWAASIGQRHFVVHDDLPKHTLDKEITNNNNSVESESLADKNLYKRTLAALGVHEDMFEAATRNYDYVYTLTKKFEQFGLRMNALRNEFNIQISQHIYKLVMNNDVFINHLIDAIPEDEKKALVDTIKDKNKYHNIDENKFLKFTISKILRGMNVSLPEPPETESTASAVSDYENFSRTMSSLMDDLFPEELSKKLLGDNYNVDEIKQSVKSAMIMKHLMEKRTSAGIQDLMNTGGTHDSFISSYKEWLGNTIKKYIDGAREENRIGDDLAESAKDLITAD